MQTALPLQEEDERGGAPKQAQVSVSDTGPGHIKAVFQEGEPAPALPAEGSAGDWLASQDRFMSLANGIMQAGACPLAPAQGLPRTYQAC